MGFVVVVVDMLLVLFVAFVLVVMAISCGQWKIAVCAIDDKDMDVIP